MSRLLDRILTSCQRFRPSLLYHEAERLEALARGYLIKTEPVATEDPSLKDVENIPVIVADDVGLYVSALGEGFRMDEMVASMAPPFEQCFVEFQRVPNRPYGLHAWGVHITAGPYPANAGPHPGDSDIPRWVLRINTYLEMRKGEPFGPVASHVCGLAEDGTWFRHADGALFWGGGPVKMFPEISDETFLHVGHLCAQLIFPALMTLSFMHCKNVSLEAVAPSERLSRSYQKRHGRPLVSYGELRIDPIRRVLEQQRKGVGGSLRKALHLCRGHFKTFTADAPLLGHATGTYWWGAQMRGAASEGVTLRDYRVEAPSKVGRAYSDANEDPPNAQQEAPRAKDPDSAGRGLAAHNRTQNYIANAIRDVGWLARSPASSEPQYDLAWLANDMLYVCEVKSLTRENEERQLRMATGQVIRYRQQLTVSGHEPCFAVICVEKQPTDPSWDALCENEGIILIWPEVATARLKDAHSRRLN